MEINGPGQVSTLVPTGQTQTEPSAQTAETTQGTTGTSTSQTATAEKTESSGSDSGTGSNVDIFA